MVEYRPMKTLHATNVFPSSAFRRRTRLSALAALAFAVADAPAQNPVIPEELREVFGPAAAAETPAPGAPDVLLRLESADAVAEALRAVLPAVATTRDETLTEDEADARAGEPLDLALDLLGLASMDRSKPVFAALWNLNEDWRRTDFLLSLPIARADLNPFHARLVGLPSSVGEDGLTAFSFGALWIAFEGDRTFVSSRASAFSARSAFHSLSPALPDALLTARVPSLSRALESIRARGGEAPDLRPLGQRRRVLSVGLLPDAKATVTKTGERRANGGSFQIRLAPKTVLDADAEGVFALVLTREKGLFLSKQLRPIAGTASPEASTAPAPTPLPEATFAAVPADALAWSLRSEAADVPFDDMRLTLFLGLNDTPSNRARRDALSDLFAAVERLAFEGAHVAALRPAGDGRLRIDLRRKDGLRALDEFGTAYLSVRDNERAHAGTNALAVLLKCDSVVSPAGFFAALHPRAAGWDALADGFGDEAKLLASLDANGDAVVNLVPAGTENAPPAPAAGGAAPAIPLDGVRARFPDWSPASVLCANPVAWEARLGAAPTTTPDPGTGAAFCAAGPAGDEWVEVLSVPPDALRASLRMLGRAARRVREREGAEAADAASAEDAWANVRRRAWTGDADAQYSLGYGYANERGERHDWDTALVWFRKAAEQGHAHAQYALGSMYWHGNGVKQDWKESYVWLRKAAEQDDPSAISALGVCCYATAKVGSGGSFEEALEWFRKGAERGDEKAEMMVAAMLALGEGCEKDEREAETIFRRLSEEAEDERIRSTAARALKNLAEQSASPD